MEKASIPREEEEETERLNKRKKGKKPDDPEEVGWRKLHADVFRAPAFGNILSCLIGAGAQIGCCFFAVLVGIVFAFANTHWRPYIYTIIIVTMALFGFINGYVTSRMLKFWGTSDFHFTACISSFMLPLMISGALLFECGFLWIAHSALRFGFAHNLMRIAGWYLLNGCSCYIGALTGYT